MKPIVHKPISREQRSSVSALFAAAALEYLHQQRHLANGETHCPDDDATIKAIAAYDAKTKESVCAIVITMPDCDEWFPVAIIPDGDLRDRLFPHPDLLSDEGRALYEQKVREYAAQQ